MFCINCGAELVVSNQEFCHSCGSKNPIISKDGKLKLKSPQHASEGGTQSKWKYTKQPVRKLKPEGSPGPLSKSCLTFAITSIALAVFSFVALGPMILFSMIFSFFFSAPILLIWVIILLVHILGLGLGIFSRVNSKRAEELELSNTLEKVGSILGIFGIIANLIPLVLALFFLSPVY